MSAWKKDTATAAAIVLAGCNSEEEREVYFEAFQHLRNVARLEYALAKQERPCPTCGHKNGI